MFEDKPYLMFVRETLSLLAGVHQAAVTDPVDAPWDPRGLAEALVHGLIGKDILPASGVFLQAIFPIFSVSIPYNQRCIFMRK